MDPSQELEDLSTRLRTCSINTPAVASLPPVARTHSHRSVSAPAFLTQQQPAAPHEQPGGGPDVDTAVGDISKILMQLSVLQHVNDSERLYAELLRQAWATYRARGLSPAQYRTLVDAESVVRRQSLASLMWEIDAKRSGLVCTEGEGEGEIEEMMREYEERERALRQRQEMLLSVLPEGEREGERWEPQSEEARVNSVTEEEMAVLMQQLEEREKEMLMKRGGLVRQPQHHLKADYRKQ
ncbi:hypothetical protein DBV05_g1153 [Lasiodiplodia theobromae]|uniref:Uncharacterized protein n=1 Tax=Lasiodiplodia theobromae TaxID=45133 RepID=A0A5N5DTF7_9PEZI|nr:hypothetical protein DBV05_g1153 [Lasiodiplodia theobromae]